MATSCSVSPATIGLPPMLWETRLPWGIGAAASSSCGTKRTRKGLLPAEEALGKKRRVSCSQPNLPDNAAHLRQLVVDQLKVRMEKVHQLQQLHTRTTPPNAANLIPSPEVAHNLERGLYNRAASFDEHVNLDTLDQRLSELCAALIQRLQQRKRGQQHSQEEASSPSVAPPTCDSEEPQEEEHVSGSSEKYQRLESLIRQARAVKFSWSQHQSCCCGGGRGGGGPAGPLPYKLEFPTPVKQFYFKTRVLQMEQPTDENPAEWDDIIREAETNIAQYQAWVVESLQKNSPSEACRA